MPPDYYKVNIIHFHNPHLIWIEVTNTENTEIRFEQIGIYGVLPQETTINFNTNNLKLNNTDKWLPAASTILKTFLENTTEVCFYPIYIDRRTSIFDDNIHKYGELIVKKRNGKLIKLSSQLTKSGFAHYDEELFRENLSSGAITNRLENFEIYDVITQFQRYYKTVNPLNRYWEKALKMQMSVYEEGQQFETVLTESNLEKHNDLMLQKVLKNKMKDFDKCKDTEEVSLGRATNIRDHRTDNPKQIMNSSLDQRYDHIKKFLNENSTNRDSFEIQPRVNRSSLLKYRQMISEKNSRDLRTTANGDSDFDYNVDQPSIFKESEKSNSSDKFEKCSRANTNKKDVVASKILQADFPQQNYTEAEETDDVGVKSNNLKKNSNNYDTIKPTRIAYGPPGLDKSKLKLVTPDLRKDSQNNKPIEHEIKEEKCNIKFGEVDSEINIDISNRLNLKDIFNKAAVEKENKTKKTIKPPEINRTFKEKSSSSSILQKKMKMYQDSKLNSSISNTESSSDKDVTNKRNSSENTNSDEEITEVIKRLNKKYNLKNKEVGLKHPNEFTGAASKNYVNPFQNVDASISVFVDKLVKPILMVHSKLNRRIQPVHEMRDIHFNMHIGIELKNMSVKHPMMLQSVSWSTILRGYSLFMVSPLGSGKTMGYLPAVCQLVDDYNYDFISSVGPIAIIVCATAKSVANVESVTRVLYGCQSRVVSYYPGVEKIEITTKLLNGCDILIATPSALVELMHDSDYGVDLARLCTFVIDDCERITKVYKDELSVFLFKIKEMLKMRAIKELKVQFILASRVWCNFMQKLAKNAPDTVVCIGAFQECVLYSKANTSVNFVKGENKMYYLSEFLKQSDRSKRTVIVCRYDEEIELVKKELVQSGYTVFSCNNLMTVEDLHNINIAWADYEEPIVGPILVCCDGNLIHMNVTDAHHLIHYSLPAMFSTFCKRFSVLNDHYPSIFKSDNETVKIKIFLEETNVEQLPKIVNFVRRCTGNVPDALDNVCKRVLSEKDIVKAENYVPICSSLLSFGECPDFYNCQERHTILKEHDSPPDWMPTNGSITCTVVYCHTPTLYSVRLKSHVADGIKKDFSQTHRQMSLTLGLYFSKETNRKLHGVAKLGDKCAFMIKQNCFIRCQVVKILKYVKGHPTVLLITLMDEKRDEITRDIYLYHLPDDLKSVETYTIHLRLANIQPKNKDITYPELALNRVKKLTECNDGIYLRGRICCGALKNCLFVDTLEVHKELSIVDESIVQYNIRQELLQKYADTKPDHAAMIKKLCAEAGIVFIEDVRLTNVNNVASSSCKGRWAHLEKEEECCVYFASAISPGSLFVRLDKFESCMNELIKDIQNYAATAEPLLEVEVGDLVLAKFPDDLMFERARVDGVDKSIIKCFFLDQGDWRNVQLKNLIPINDYFIEKIPFQAIECRMVGVLPPGEDWTDFSVNWLYDICFDKNGDAKPLYVVYCTTGKPEFTKGRKYAITIFDTNGDQDIIINQLMIDLNLAKENEEELKYLTIDSIKKDKPNYLEREDDDWEKISIKSEKSVDTQNVSPPIFLQKPIRSVPLVGSDDDSDDDKWQINMTEDFKSLLQPMTHNKASLPMIANNTLNLSQENVLQALPEKESESHNINKSANSETNTAESTSQEYVKSSDCSSSSKVLETSNSDIQVKRRPRIIWRQDKTTVTVKIMLIGADYVLKIDDRALVFTATACETDYTFEIRLYGVVNKNKCFHDNKGQYILVKLFKVVNKTWLTLTRDGGIKKWITYDHDDIDTSSDEEEVDKKPLENIIKNIDNDDSETEDEDFLDDAYLQYRK